MMSTASTYYILVPLDAAAASLHKSSNNGHWAAQSDSQRANCTRIYSVHRYQSNLLYQATIFAKISLPFQRMDGIKSESDYDLLSFLHGIIYTQ